MNRRGFLKSIGKVVAGCAIVPSVATAKARTGPEFISPSAQMYRGFTLLELVKKQSPRCPDIAEVLSEDNEFIKGMMQDFPVKIHEGL